MVSTKDRPALLGVAGKGNQTGGIQMLILGTSSLIPTKSIHKNG